MKLPLSVIFKAFLISNGLLEKARYNFENEPSAITVDMDFLIDSNGIRPESVVASLFLFENTKEGSEFWIDIDNKWRRAVPKLLEL